MNIYLAPMEGVLDHYLRHRLTALGGYHRCVTEFVRITDQRLPRRVFHRICPELNQGGTTPAGTPVIVQLLGSDPAMMAANALRAAELGAPGIDLNFGCPAKIVNRNKGGAILLQEPQQVFEVVSAVRRAVPPQIPVSAKIRLGYDDTELALDNAQAVEDAGADLLTVHARTRADGYRHPARWEWLGKIRQHVTLPMVANGDIKSVEDALRCREISGGEDIMIGRGALACPSLARQIQHHRQGLHHSAMGWPEAQQLLLEMAQTLRAEIKERYVLARVKQWLVYLRGHYPEAVECFAQTRRLHSVGEFEQLLLGA